MSNIKFRRPRRRYLESYTTKDKEFIITASVKDICKRFSIGKTTAYTYKKILRGEKNLETRKYDFTYKIYKSFNDKNLNKISEYDMKIYIQLKPERLSKINDKSIDEIIYIQKRFARKLKKTNN